MIINLNCNQGPQTSIKSVSSAPSPRNATPALFSVCPQSYILTDSQTLHPHEQPAVSAALTS